METKIEIAAHQSVVWEALVDVEDWPRWTESIDTVERLDDGPLELGSRARVKQPGMPPLVWQVSEMDKGRGFVWTTRSPGVTTTGGHWLQAGPAGTTLTLTLEQRGVLAGFVRAVTGRRTRRYLASEAAGIKACSEQPG
jgi:uncharacterized membrane protein